MYQGLELQNLAWNKCNNRCPPSTHTHTVPVTPPTHTHPLHTHPLTSLAVPCATTHHCQLVYEWTGAKGVRTVWHSALRPSTAKTTNHRRRKNCGRISVCGIADALELGSELVTWDLIASATMRCRSSLVGPSRVYSQMYYVVSK